MSSDNFNNTENNSHNEEELTSILKRLSEILDKSVSLDEAVAMVKEQNAPTDTAPKKTNTTMTSDNGQLSFDLEATSDIDDTATDEDISDEPVADEPVTDEVVIDEPVADEPVTKEPVADESVADELVADEDISEDEAEANDLIRKIMSAIQTTPEETKEETQTEIIEDIAEVTTVENTVAQEAVETAEELETNADQTVETEPVTEQPVIFEDTIEKQTETDENTPVFTENTQEETPEDSKEEKTEEIATPKIFDELLACFDGHKLPEDFRFSDYNTEESAVSEDKNELPEENAVSDDETAETAEDANSVTEAAEEEPGEQTEDEPSFTPIEHEISQDDDELFSKIFSEEKTERKNRENDKKKWQKQNDGVSPILTNLFDWIEVIVLSAAFALLLFTFVFRLAVVEGDSMMNTLYDNELLVISDLMYTPEQGDIIVFTSSGHAEPLVKRVIATEGQTVDIDFETWTVTVDGVPLKEEYVNRVAGSMHHKDVVFPLTVTEGHIFVMGDNRNNSKDSRDSSIGLVDTRNILGEVKVRLFPFNRFGKVD